jgi:hypothetical protein
MARHQQPQGEPIILIKLKPLTEETDYSQALNNPFEITGPLGTFQQEAQAKGLVVVVTVSFITLDDFYGPLEAAQEDGPND